MKKKAENKINIKYENDNVRIEMDMLKGVRIESAPAPGRRHSVAVLPCFMIPREVMIDKPEIESWEIIEAAIEAMSEMSIETLIDNVAGTIEKFTGDVCHFHMQAELINDAVDVETLSIPDGTLALKVYSNAEFDKTKLMAIADPQKRDWNIRGMTGIFKTVARKLLEEAGRHRELFTAEKLIMKLTLAVCDGPAEENEPAVAEPGNK